jgi:hypothetical protein
MTVEGNPYLREFERLADELARPPDYADPLHRRKGLSSYDRRVWCVRRYAFAIPTEAALAVLARFAPIIELGAGTGYWAYLLRRRGVDCLAFDAAPPDQSPNPHRFNAFTWTAVERGSTEVLRDHADRALLLCWPPYRDPFAAHALSAYAGTTLLYIGEAAGGHAADDTFFTRLERDWLPLQEVPLPNWPATADRLVVYQRASLHQGHGARVTVDTYLTSACDAAGGAAGTHDRRDPILPRHY